MNEQRPKISIVLPVYNGAKYLKAAIDSCLLQAYPNWELIIVDDCSTDNTPSIARSYTDPRVRYIRNEVNQRLPRSLNVGFRQATGEFLTWTSDDNEYLPTALEEMLNFLQKHLDVDFVYADMTIRNLETGETRIRRLGDVYLKRENEIGACFLYRRKVYEGTGGFDARLEWVEDYDYWIRVSNKFRMRHYAKVLYIYGDHPKSLSRSKSYSIVYYRDILRHMNGYITSGELLESTRQFWVNINENLSDPVEKKAVLKKMVDKNFQISPFRGVLFCSMLSFLIFRKLLRKAVSPVINIRSRAVERSRWQNFFGSLAVDDGKKNVICVVPYMVVGGAEKVIEDIVWGLSKSGYDFHLICNAKDEDHPWCREFKTRFKNVLILPADAEDDDYLRYLPELIRRVNADAVFIGNSTTAYRCLPKLKAKFPRLKCMDIIHAEGWAGSDEKYLWVAPYIDRRFCISQHVLSYMKGMYKSLPDAETVARHLTVIHNGVDLERYVDRSSHIGSFRRQYNIPESSRIIAFVGRLSQEKRPFLFVDIAQELLARSGGSDWKFVMAGDGPCTKDIKARLKADGLEKYFILPGMINNIKELLADTFLLLVVSKDEGIPLVIQEAFAMDVPVVSTDVGAIKEIMRDSVNGYLVKLDENVVENFVAKILKLDGDKKNYNDLSQRTRDSILPEFSRETMVGRYRQTIGETLRTV